ncbi:MAG: hypothetical protein H8D45_06555 [Bacteroidetes bacterium]|nr:hypothetical protein [Bacteroidota bacterium]MBL7103192.1 hypothetical protein [Bacteroidales bacterium]
MKKNVFVVLILLMACNITIYAGNWTVVQLPEVSKKWSLRSISFPSSDQGWAVGMDYENKNKLKGVILKYQDGKWKNVTPPEVSSSWKLTAVCFVSVDEGWAAGFDIANEKGVILHYKRGNWSMDEVPATYMDKKGWSLYSLSFLSASEGWAVGGNNNGKGGIILYYKEGKWTAEEDEDLLKGHIFRGVDAVSSDDIWIGGQREGHYWGIDKFTRPWGTFEIHSDKSGFSQVKQPSLLRNVIRNDYYFFNANNGWCVGIFPTKEPNYTGRLLNWDGENWKNIKLDYGSKWWYLEAIDFSSEKYGWIVGVDLSKDKGILVEYNNDKWTFVSKDDLLEVSKDWGLYDISNAGENEFWAAGTDRNGNKGIILHYSE